MVSPNPIEEVSAIDKPSAEEVQANVEPGAKKSSSQFETSGKNSDDSTESKIYIPGEDPLEGRK